MIARSSSAASIMIASGAARLKYRVDLSWNVQILYGLHEFLNCVNPGKPFIFCRKQLAKFNQGSFFNYRGRCLGLPDRRPWYDCAQTVLVLLGQIRTADLLSLIIDHFRIKLPRSMNRAKVPLRVPAGTP